jgi:hypothetical protein
MTMNVECQHDDLTDLGAASEETRAMTYGADDSKGGLWILPGLSLD